MSDEQIQQLAGDLSKTTEQLHDAQQYIKEIQIQYSIDTLILAGLVVIVFQTFSYLLYGAIVTDLDKILYMFSLLIGPSALFLLFLHLYEIYGVLQHGEKSIPLTLDLMYFIYLIIAFSTMIGLHSYYQHYDISPTFLSTAWSLAVILLCGEVIIALLLAQFLVTMFITPRLPHFFEHPLKEQQPKPLPLQRHIVKPRQVYYFRKKPDVNLWQNEESFVRYK